MASFARWNRMTHAIEVDLPGSPIQRKVSIDVTFNGTGTVKRLIIGRYASAQRTTSPVMGFISCPGIPGMTQLAPGATGSCALAGPPSDAEPDLVIITPGFQQAGCSDMGTEFTLFDLPQVKETASTPESGMTRLETATWELTGPQTSESIIITIVIEDNA